jgi:hypothetical protein
MLLTKVGQASSLSVGTFGEADVKFQVKMLGCWTD